MAKDFLLDTDGDLLQKDGDLVFDEADGQNIESLLFLNQGDLKYAPITGVGILKITNARIGSTQVVEGNIKQQLMADNWKDESVSFDSITGNISVDAVR